MELRKHLGSVLYPFARWLYPFTFEHALRWQRCSCRILPKKATGLTEAGKRAVAEGERRKMIAAQRQAMRDHGTCE